MYTLISTSRPCPYLSLLQCGVDIFSHTLSLQHSPSKNRHNHHSHDPKSGLAHLRHYKPRCCARTPTRSCTRSTRACPTCSRAGSSRGRTSRRRSVVPIAEDSPRVDSVLHEAVLQIRHALLHAQTVVPTVTVEGFDGCGLAAFFEDGGCVGGEGCGRAADGAGDV